MSNAYKRSLKMRQFYDMLLNKLADINGKSYKKIIQIEMNNIFGFAAKLIRIAKKYNSKTFLEFSKV